VARASHNLMGIIDTTTNRTIGAVQGLQRVLGVALTPEYPLGFASAGKENVLGVFSLTDNQLAKKIPGGTDPDATFTMKVAPRLRGPCRQEGTLIDPQTEILVATIDLGREPEFCQADPSTGLIYQNLEDTSEVVLIDPRMRAVIRRHKLAPGEGPTGLALDAVNRRLFSTTAIRS